MTFDFCTGYCQPRSLLQCEPIHKSQLIGMSHHISSFSWLNYFTSNRATLHSGAILKPLCLSKQLTLCSEQNIDQLFLGHISLLTTFSCNAQHLFLHNMCTVIIQWRTEGGGAQGACAPPPPPPPPPPPLNE